MRKLLGFGAFLLLNACRSLNPSDLSHEVGRPVLNPSPSQWIKVSEEQFRDVLMYGFEKDLGIKTGGLAAETYPARLLIQSHMDRIDSRLRKTYPELLQGVPKPRAQLVMSELSNAYVAPTSVCTGRKPELKAFQGTKTDRFWEFDAHTGQLVGDPDPTQPVLCIASPYSDQDLKALLDFQIASRTKCRIQIHTKTLTLSKECQTLFTDSEDRPASAGDFALMLIPDVIVYYAGLIADYPEDQLIYWIAHEMAHYYRAHGITPKEVYPIYYRLGATNAQQRPARDPELDAFAAKVEALREKMGEKGLSALNAAERKEWQDLSLEAYEEKIGQYTAEQEADELALEWLVDDGFDTGVALAAALRHLELYGPNSRRTADYDWNYERCQEAFARGWQDEKEYPIFVPLGDLSDDHHSSCYRAFNLYREIGTHKYTKRAANKKPALTKDWQALQATVKKDVKAMKH